MCLAFTFECQFAASSITKVHCDDAGCLSDQVYGFGSGKRGQLGVSKDKIKSINLPKVIRGFEDVEIAGIAANGDHSAALSGKSITLPLHHTWFTFLYMIF